MTQAFSTMSCASKAAQPSNRLRQKIIPQGEPFLLRSQPSGILLQERNTEEHTGCLESGGGWGGQLMISGCWSDFKAHGPALGDPDCICEQATGQRVNRNAIYIL